MYTLTDNQIKALRTHQRHTKELDTTAPGPWKVTYNETDHKHPETRRWTATRTDTQGTTHTLLQHATLRQALATANTYNPARNMTYLENYDYTRNHTSQRQEQRRKEFPKQWPNG